MPDYLIKDIYDHIVSRFKAGRLRAGRAPVGEILFLHAFFLEYGDKNALIYFQKLLSASLENRTKPSRFYIYDGLAPLALVLAHDRQFCALPVYDHLKRAALQELDADAQTLNHDDLDFLTGWSGLTLLSDGLGNGDAASHLMSLARAVADPALAPLCRFPRDDTDQPVVDLGLAHGNIGLLCVLARCADNMRDVKTMAQALMWALESQEMPQSKSRFPYFAGQTFTSRVGWCYGDVAMLIGLAQCASAGIYPKDRGLFDRVEQSVLDRLEAGAKLDDACMCHGTASLAAISVFLLCAGRPRLASVQPTLCQTLAKQVPRLLARDTCQTDLLNGLSGIGLALLSVRARRRMPWQTLFLT